MTVRRAMLGVVLTLAVALALGEPTAGVGPPAPSGKLTKAQEARLRQARSALSKAAFAGEMGRALRLAQEEESLRRQWQGSRYWQTIDACFDVERWSRLARLTATGQKEAGRALQHDVLGLSLRARGQYVAAERAFRRSLAIHKEALGEEHPATAMSNNNVASCLNDQGKAAQALPLHEKALAISKKVLGEEHPSTATSYNNLASCLKAQGQAAQALPLYEKALAIFKKVLGEEHPATATSYNNVAVCLNDLGKAGRALPLAEKALTICKKVSGEEHADLARSYNTVASCLENLGKHMQTLPLRERALAVCRKALGEEHPFTATSYNNVAFCLQAQGKSAQALPLHAKALAIRKMVLGEEHPDTAGSYTNVAFCLKAQGKATQALPLAEKALAIRKKVLGEDHPNTAHCYNNVAVCLLAQGKAAQALPQAEKALAIRKKVLGEEHPSTAQSYNDVASCLNTQGKAALALPFFEKGLAIRKKVLGEEHSDTAESYNNVAFCLNDQGKAAHALPLYKTALALCKKVLGEEHPDTAINYTNFAFCLHAMGKHREAIAQWDHALIGFDLGRLARADMGFDRARFGAARYTPRQGLALVHAQLKEAEKAWQYAEADLARNLLDDLAGAAPEDLEAAAHLRQLDHRLLPLFGLAKLTEDQKTLRDELIRQRKEALTQLAKRAVARSAGQVASLAEVQKLLPADAAIALWVDGQEDNWGCVLRSQGKPRWVRLEGSGVKGAWVARDYAQTGLLHISLANISLQQALSNLQLTGAEKRKIETALRQQQELTKAVRNRWFAPLEKQLKAEGALPPVKRLFVVPTRYMAGLPVEAIAPGYTISYTPSATLLARSLAKPRPLAATTLALGDPNFRVPPPPAPPRFGLLIPALALAGGAAKAGLRAGDVLLRYDGTKLDRFDDLVAAVKKTSKARAVYWRDGKEHTVELSLPFGIALDKRPAPEAVRAWREANAPAVRAEAIGQLPGTRAEVLSLQRLLGKGCTTLLGSDASEQALDALAARGELKKFRLLHFATHGTVDRAYAERSRLLLARDKLPTPAENLERVLKGKRPYTGELTVEAILEWKLDADLVVLSACETGLGHASQGDGLLGFPYALMRAGARSVVLTRWKVDDKATTLLMVRFYENLLGKAKGLAGPMKRAEALAEAKKWLRELPKKEAEKLTAAVDANKLSGTRGTIVELNPKQRPKLPPGDRPYEHPFFWAAFVLIGDPN